MVIRACRDEETFQALVKAMDYNMAHGAYTIFPCECEPPCQRPTDEELERLNERISGELSKLRTERAAKAEAEREANQGIDNLVENAKAIAGILERIAPDGLPDLRDIMEVQPMTGKDCPQIPVTIRLNGSTTAEL